ALEKFEEEVGSGSLTVVGAVYDFRNDMRQGFGKVAIVDVNGNSDAAKIQAFERGVLGLGPALGKKGDAEKIDKGEKAEKADKEAPEKPEKPKPEKAKAHGDQAER